jgi:hypothetical protein
MGKVRRLRLLGLCKHNVNSVKNKAVRFYSMGEFSHLLTSHLHTSSNPIFF